MTVGGRGRPVGRVTVRRLGPADAALLVADAGQVFDNPVDPEAARRFLAMPGHLIVAALAGGGLVGFASGAVLLHPDKPAALSLNEVGVAEGFRRRGIARRLVAAILEAARREGCGAAWVATEADNAAARALYRSAAGRETEGVVVYDWDGRMQTG
jgi:ribosomal protein S18 acetylase RimI-like enzyme